MKANIGAQLYPFSIHGDQTVILEYFHWTSDDGLTFISDSLPHSPTYKKCKNTFRRMVKNTGKYEITNAKISECMLLEILII